MNPLRHKSFSMTYKLWAFPFSVTPFDGVLWVSTGLWRHQGGRVPGGIAGSRPQLQWSLFKKYLYVLGTLRCLFKQILTGIQKWTEQLESSNNLENCSKQLTVTALLTLTATNRPPDCRNVNNKSSECEKLHISLTTSQIHYLALTAFTALRAPPQEREGGKQWVGGYGF